MVVGRMYRLFMKGVYSTLLASAATVTINVKVGGVTLVTGTATALLANATNQDFDSNLLITIRTTGSSGTAMIDGSLAYSVGNNTAALRLALNNGTATSTVNTTISNLIDITVTYSAATMGNSISNLQFSLESLN